MKIIIMGIQGSGKSTQGNLLSKKLKIPYLSSGHILRDMAREKTRLGRYVKETINAGVLIPDKKMRLIMEEYLLKSRYGQGFVLDGYPRTVYQAKNFSHKINLVIFLSVSDKEALWRLAYRNDVVREDETVKAVRKRIELFHKITKPVLLYYKRKKLLAKINGEQSINKVYKDIIKEIGKIKKKST